MHNSSDDEVILPSKKQELLLDQDGFDIYKLAEIWSSLEESEKESFLEKLPREQLSVLFLELDTYDQKQLLKNVPPATRKKWIKILEPDDLADLLREVSDEEKEETLSYLGDNARKEVKALLAYAEDEAGGLMNPRFIRIRPELLVEEALSYMRAQMRLQSDPIYYGYVLDREQVLLGVVSLRQLFLSNPTTKVEEIMTKELIEVPYDMDQEVVSKIFYRYDYVALPVVNADKKMIGIITSQDVQEVTEEETTEDFHKIGGMSSTDKPYFQLTWLEMMKKRVGWLLILFLGETLTAYALGVYEKHLERAMVLAFFIPLITSSGGNSGSQISTLMIRAMALGEVRLRDWWRVLGRELLSGISLGVILGLTGFLKVYFLPSSESKSSFSLDSIGMVVALSLVGVVMWGTLIGSMLPFILRRVGFDPASASAPFVATLVDVAGVMIYFTVAAYVLGL
jgi:magnesium transporter